jgi:hypothetical protein
MTVVRARALCFPSYDHGFARVVEAILAQDPEISPLDLQARLRRLAPSATVRTKELSGEQDETLYVFRDGRWGREADPAWWTDPRVGHVTVSSETGAALATNDAFLRLVGAREEWVIGRLYHEFVLPQARVDADVLYQTALETGLVHSVASVIGPGGRAITCEFRGETQGDRIEVWVREAFLAESPST